MAFKDELVSLPDEKLMLMAVNFYRMSYGLLARYAAYEDIKKSARARLKTKARTLRAEYQRVFANEPDALKILDELANEIDSVLA